MTERITRNFVDGAFGRFVRAAVDAGVKGADTWRLTYGSKMNGNSYGVYALELPSYGHGTVYGFTSIGFTARDAYNYLMAGAYALELVNGY